MKIIINRCYGGFEYSEEALGLANLRGGNVTCRTCPIMVQIVEELGARASSEFSNLGIVAIPDDVDWVIKEYDGREWIAERHRTWA